MIGRSENKTAEVDCAGRADADQRGTEGIETNCLPNSHIREIRARSVCVIRGGFAVALPFKRELDSASRADTPASPGAQPQDADKSPRTFLGDELGERQDHSD